MAIRPPRSSQVGLRNNHHHQRLNACLTALALFWLFSGVKLDIPIPSLVDPSFLFSFPENSLIGSPGSQVCDSQRALR